MVRRYIVHFEHALLHQHGGGVDRVLAGVGAGDLVGGHDEALQVGQAQRRLLIAGEAGIGGGRAGFTGLAAAAGGGCRRRGRRADGRFAAFAFTTFAAAGAVVLAAFAAARREPSRQAEGRGRAQRAPVLVLPCDHASYLQSGAHPGPSANHSQ
ncbi:MAG: hypothetical protein R3C16_12370 [Hyphomonadaceae bacterium]